MTSRTCFMSGCEAPVETIANTPDCGVPDARPACAEHAHHELVEHTCELCGEPATVWATRPVGCFVESHVWCELHALERYAPGDHAIALPLNPADAWPLRDITENVRARQHNARIAAAGVIDWTAALDRGAEIAKKSRASRGPDDQL